MTLNYVPSDSDFVSFCCAWPFIQFLLNCTLLLSCHISCCVYIYLWFQEPQQSKRNMQKDSSFIHIDTIVCHWIICFLFFILFSLIQYNKSILSWRMANFNLKRFIEWGCIHFSRQTRIWKLNMKKIFEKLWELHHSHNLFTNLKIDGSVYSSYSTFFNLQ